MWYWNFLQKQKTRKNFIFQNWKKINSKRQKLEKLTSFEKLTNSFEKKHWKTKKIESIDELWKTDEFLWKKYSKNQKKLRKLSFEGITNLFEKKIEKRKKNEKIYEFW